MGGDAVKLLALDTATDACSAALQTPAGVLHCQEVIGRDHTRRLPAMVGALLAEAGLRVADLDGIACGIGPGSFAGVRIGVSFAKGMALVTDIPLIGVTSLEMLAEGANADAVLTVIDARLAAVYAAAWIRQGGDWVPHLAPSVCLPAALPAAPAAPDALAWVGVGSGFAAYADTLVSSWGVPLQRVDADALPDARQALRLATLRLQAGEGQDAAALQPCYLRNKVALTAREQIAARESRRSEGGP